LDLFSLYIRVSKYDEFIKGLYDIFCKVPPVTKYFAVNRSDYMVHQNCDLLQIEMNTISVAFPALSSKIIQMHKLLLDESVVENRALEEVAAGFDAALRLYGNECRHALMIVRPFEGNSVDQDLLIEECFSKFSITIRKISLFDVTREANIEFNRKLFINGFEYGLVYYRAGYTTEDYPSGAEWSGRLLLESSQAIKCPDVGSQLAGMKKTQQVLCEPGIVEKFLPQREAEQIRRCFTRLYALDNDETRKCIIARAIGCPHDYVLKPQREGGGNNFYGYEMVHKLKTMSAEELSAYILMDLIKPIPHETTLVRNGEAIDCKAVSELGIYGVYIGDLSQEIHEVLNYQAGYLLRTKAHGVLEGGVASGFSVLDSLRLV